MTEETKGAQAPTPGPLSGNDELIERGLRSIRTYDAVRLLRDALTATTARLTGYDWNADPDAITKQQGDAFAAADRVFSDLDAAVAAHPDIDLPECDACNGTGKIEEPAQTEGANQHSASVRSCDECDGCGFAPDESLAPTAPVEASGSEREDTFNGDDAALVASITALLDLPDSALSHRVPGLAKQLLASAASRLSLRPQPSGETREAVASLIVDRTGVGTLGLTHEASMNAGRDLAGEILALLSARSLALGGQQGETIEQRFPALNDHLIRMASSGNTGSLAEWGEFFECLRVALSTTPARAEASGQ